MQVETLINILFGVAATSTSLLALTFFFTPAKNFLICKLVKTKALLGIITRSGTLKIVDASNEGGLLVTKKDGYYRETAGSMYLVKRQPMYFAYEMYGSTGSFKYAAYIQQLRKLGHKLNLYSDLEELWASGKIKMPVEFSPGFTISSEGMQNMWPSVDNPLLNMAHTSNKTAQERLKQGKDLSKMLGYAFLAVIIGFIAWKLYSGSAPPAEVVCHFPSVVNGAVNGTLAV